MSFKQVHMAALAAALLAGTAGVAYAQSSSPSMAPAKHGASSPSMNSGAASHSGSATTGAASDEMKKGETTKESPKAGSMKGEATKGEAAKTESKTRATTESKGEASKAEKEGKSSGTMGGNAKADSKATSDTKAAASGDKADNAATTGKSADDTKASASKAGGNINLTAQQKTTIKKTIIDNKSAPRVTSVNFHISVGTVVPTTVHYAPLPASIIEIHPAWRGYDYFVYEDQVIVIEPRSHKIVEIIVVS